MGSTTTSSAIILTVLLVASFGGEISAKRGCSAFGHSCYGGHGKRSYSEGTELEAGRNKEEAQMDYDLARPNVETVQLVPAQGYSRQEQQRTASLEHQRPSANSWSILLRKLLVPYRRPYMAYSEAQQ